MSTLNQEIERLKNAKVAIRDSLIRKEVVVPEEMTIDGYAELIDTFKGGTSSEEVTATRANVLVGTTTITSDSNDEIVEGTMPNNGSVSQSLNAGGSYTIPAGYHDGTGVISANSLASQIQATATAADVAKGKTFYSAGSNESQTGI